MELMLSKTMTVFPFKINQGQRRRARKRLTEDRGQEQPIPVRSIRRRHKWEVTPSLRIRTPDGIGGHRKVLGRSRAEMAAAGPEPLDPSSGEAIRIEASRGCERVAFGACRGPVRGF